ncbi:hypothetical protein DVH05_022235 [Phytophthora capsici]|nr:hypothetical protein DVH05_022235 [Phytophthora capsici]
MASKLRHPVLLLLISAASIAPQVIASVSTVPVNLLSVEAPSFGSIAAGCSLCRDSGNCSVAMNDTSSGVFCGDLHTANGAQSCCCPYYTSCRVTSKSSACECGVFAIRHERLSVTEEVNETEIVEQESFTLEADHAMDNQMSVSTEILIHLSAYLALFVFAVYVDQWVECFSDFRRNQMVAYGEAVDMKLLRFRQRFGKRRSDSKTNPETDDNLPLLVLESPAPVSRPVFTFANDSDDDLEDTPEGTVKECEAVPEVITLVTIPVDAVQEVSTSSPASPAELEEIPLE